MDSDEEQFSIDEEEENSEVGEQNVEQEVVIGSPEKRPRFVQNVDYLEFRKTTSTSVVQSTSKPKRQLTLSQSLARGQSYSNEDPHQKEITVALARAFAGNSLAHCLIESNLFRDALKAMNPRYVPPARGGMKRQIAAQVELLKQKMREALSSASKISLCVDLWSKRALTASFVGITAHFVDRGKHSAKNVAALVKEALSEWDISDDKVQCIVTDNGSNVVKAFREWQDIIVESEMNPEEVNYETIPSHGPTWWLTLGKVIVRVLKLWDPLTTLFISKDKLPRILEEFFSSDESLPVLQFLHSILGVFEKPLLLLQKSKGLLLELVDIVNAFKQQLNERKTRKFFRASKRVSLQRLGRRVEAWA
uniref:Transposase n=1 Tax=Plectus sambesii TaxID=2011161 RepID=A0A914W558_9BILA